MKQLILAAMVVAALAAAPKSGADSGVVGGQTLCPAPAGIVYDRSEWAPGGDATTRPPTTGCDYL